jgi:hypothetical protein
MRSRLYTLRWPSSAFCSATSFSSLSSRDSRAARFCSSVAVKLTVLGADRRPGLLRPVSCIVVCQKGSFEIKPSEHLRRFAHIRADGFWTKDLSFSASSIARRLASSTVIDRCCRAPAGLSPYCNLSPSDSRRGQSSSHACRHAGQFLTRRLCKNRCRPRPAPPRQTPRWAAASQKTRWPVGGAARHLGRLPRKDDRATAASG